MQQIKGGSAREINLYLNNTGNKIWAKGSYDHFIRNNKELKKPIKVGFVENPDDWKYTYVNWIFLLQGLFYVV